ncbi:hypothetical protein SAMN02910447_02986 [Ruminococcus sp. YE71]|uniref:cyclophilin-like fold protein n=1 Tax=unclassified Ruminococcus TaxID=2608920 RepID=UPI000889B6A5|nr:MULTISPECIES: cyclophilin-like fold protein [unclassified Ruminococcus]SDA28996.1 hypothetical protein SAMN02910446_03057 [Ruminococcus sp. YE78]SFW47324.1 hypothetical protein SAMN02910447_02986 [Ruminococcus sp. YE71]
MSKKKKIVLTVIAVLLIGVVIFMFIPKDRKSDKRMTVTVGDKTFAAVLYDNKTADELYSRLPLTLDMRELNGNEKYCDLDKSLPSKSSPAGHISKGDIKLFGDDCLVLFYEGFMSGYSYTNIGYIEDTDGLADALGSGNVTMTFEAK